MMICMLMTNNAKDHKRRTFPGGHRHRARLPAIDRDWAQGLRAIDKLVPSEDVDYHQWAESTAVSIEAMGEDLARRRQAWALGSGTKI